jgi:hypothetical protein
MNVKLDLCRPARTRSRRQVLEGILKPDGSATVVPEELRRQDVRVGQHFAISLVRCVKRFEDVYSALGRSELILAVAAAHHRLLWIHPFSTATGALLSCRNLNGLRRVSS